MAPAAAHTTSRLVMVDLKGFFLWVRFVIRIRLFFFKKSKIMPLSMIDLNELPSKQVKSDFNRLFLDFPKTLYQNSEAFKGVFSFFGEAIS